MAFPFVVGLPSVVVELPLVVDLGFSLEEPVPSVVVRPSVVEGRPLEVLPLVVFLVVGLVPLEVASVPFLVVEELPFLDSLVATLVVSMACRHVSILGIFVFLL